MSQEKERSCATCVMENVSMNSEPCTWCWASSDRRAWTAKDAAVTRQEPAQAPNEAAAIPAQPDAVSDALTAALETAAQHRVLPRRHSHYFKDVSGLESIDVYRVLYLYRVTDPCIQHAIKKLLCAGQRGAKDQAKDVQEAIDTLERWHEMREEEGSQQ